MTAFTALQVSSAADGSADVGVGDVLRRLPERPDLP